MAKGATKTTGRATQARATRARSTAKSIDRAAEEALLKLKTLGIEDQLQRDIEWCLGSFRADGNPVGLYETAGRALIVFRNERAKKTKGVTAKFIGDLENAVSASGS